MSVDDIAPPVTFAAMGGQTKIKKSDDMMEEEEGDDHDHDRDLNHTAGNRNNNFTPLEEIMTSLSSKEPLAGGGGGNKAKKQPQKGGARGGGGGGGGGGNKSVTSSLKREDGSHAQLTPSTSETFISQKNQKKISKSSKMTQNGKDKRQTLVPCIKEERVDSNTREGSSSVAEPDAIISVNLLTAEIHIEDNEFNTFDINLAAGRKKLLIGGGNVITQSMTNTNQNDSESIVSAGAIVTEAKSQNSFDPDNAGFTINIQLAGEVPGLKPPAVARKPKAPRLFIVNRSGEATEVVSSFFVCLLVCLFVCLFGRNKMFNFLFYYFHS
jgi:hypothetical protein